MAVFPPDFHRRCSGSTALLPNACNAIYALNLTDRLGLWSAFTAPDGVE